MNTIRIYETDSHARRLQARVLSCEESENGWLVELDRTIFYPTGGGQPCDMGTLGGADVTETFLRGLTKRLNAALQGRGGGKPGFVQGSLAASRTDIEAFFTAESCSMPDPA